MAFAVSDLISKVRSRADLVGSAFITDTEITEFLNVGWAKLYDLLTTLYEDFNLTSTQLVLQSGVNSYSLAGLTPIVYKLRGVDLQLSSAVNDVLPLPKFDWAERGKYVGLPNAWVGRYSSELRYLYQGTNLKFVPVPSGGQTVTVNYVPALTPLAAPVGGSQPAGTQNTLPEIIQAGWEELIVLEAAVLCAVKEEGMAGNLAVLKVLRDETKNDIEGAAANRDADAPMRLIKRADQMRTWWSDNDGGSW